MNVTNFSAFVSPETSSVTLKDLITDYCYQYDEKVQICVLLIFTYYILRVSILPVSWRFMTENIPGIYRSIIDDMFGFIVGISETVMLLSASILLIFFWLQGFNPWLKAWVYTIGGMVLLIQINNIKEFYRSGRCKGFWKRQLDDFKNFVGRFG